MGDERGQDGGVHLGDVPLAAELRDEEAAWSQARVDVAEDLESGGRVAQDPVQRCVAEYFVPGAGDCLLAGA